MAFRVGTGGEELWERCKANRVAAIHYGPMLNIDLAKYSENEPKDQWKLLAPSQKSSLRMVAYRMQPDDVIYVKVGPSIVARGRILGPYFFDRRNRIVSSCGLAFQHQVPVHWESFEQPIRIQLGTQQLPTVARLTSEDVERIDAIRVDGEPATTRLSSDSMFGDPVQNRETECKAVAWVTDDYERRGWKVESVEDQCCGYDLRCTRGRSEDHIEVKGVAGDVPAFVITANEVRQAKTDSRFILGVVTAARSKQPEIRWFTGREFVAAYELDPLQFRATPVP